MAVRLRDVAEAAGVSVKTVSNVVNDHPHVSEPMRRRVQHALDEAGYRPNATARSLRTGRSNLIGLAVPRLHDPYFSQVADAVVNAATERGWTVLVEQTGGDARREAVVLSGLRPALIDGLIFHPLALDAVALAAVERDTPVVLLGEHLGSEHLHLAVDGVAAAHEVVSHLVATGRTHIACIGAQPGPWSATAGQRLAGYRTALADAGLLHVPGYEAAVPDYQRSDGAAAALRLLLQPEPPDAIFCFNDLLALGAIRALHDEGVRVPQDIAVAGFDDITEACYAIPSLTTIAPDKTALASHAVELLARRIGAGGKAPRQGAVAATGYPDGSIPVVPHHLVIRESTAT